ncbi:MAG: histidine phosphatase family protein [Sneathiellales bacterium]|nr:histidine phosphatase family protein [Sneathiellales bacterium]
MNNNCSIVIDLFRHGKVDGPPALYGQTDIACTPDGHSRLLTHLSSSADTVPDIVLTSPLKRCAFTAKVYTDRHSIRQETLPFLQEMDFGKWDGVPFDRLTAEQENLEKFWKNPATFPPPQGETLDQFNERVNRFWSCLETYLPATRIAVIAHGGVIRMLLAQALNLDYKNPSLFTALSIDNASKSRVELFRDGSSNFYNVKFINHVVNGEKTP